MTETLTTNDKKHLRNVRYYQRNADKLREKNREWRNKNKDKLAAIAKKYRDKNKKDVQKKTTAWKRNNPARQLFYNARLRAKNKSVPFDIEVGDIVIPEFCPVLGIRLFCNIGKGATPNSPTLDRKIPSLGYVKGNIAVISHRANTMKQDASLDEIIALVEWMKSNSLPKLTQ